MNKQLLSLLIGLLIGAAIAIFGAIKLWPKDPEPFNLKPYRDSIRVLRHESNLAAGRAIYHLKRADSLEQLLKRNSKKVKHDIEVIETMDHRALRMLHDSIMRTAGLR